MSKGLSEKERTEVYRMLNAIYSFFDINEKLATIPKWKTISYKMFAHAASELSEVPVDEDGRIAFLTAALEVHDGEEPSYSTICANYVWTSWLAAKNQPSEMERKCVAHVVEAFRAKIISRDDLPMDDIQSLLIAHMEFNLDFPDKTEAELEELFNWYETLVSDGDLEYREWCGLKVRHAVYKGDFDEARTAIDKFIAFPRTEESDCEGCELDKLIQFYLMMGDVVNANKHMRHIFDKRWKCASNIPEKTRIQQALIAQFVGEETGMPKKQMALIKKAARNIYADKFLIFEAALFISAAQNLGKLDEARSVLEMFRPVVAEFPYEMGNFHFYLAAHLLQLAGQDADAADDAQNWLDLARAHAQAFDSRNGNDFYARTLDDALAKGGVFVPTAS